MADEARPWREQLRILWGAVAFNGSSGVPMQRRLLVYADVVDALYQPFPIPGAARGHIWHHVPATRRPRHFHAEPELNLIAAGRAAFGMGEAVMAVEAGDLLWWPPGQDHV